ncbi:hypothetical protein B0J12DRAFT_694899 [Macrophomina phaseolina]|uniref:Uncharacterized protein n=1 Tax=Macrophomina phaseolina TaxID=35725 RepID=A0ABQ8GQY3_9PEZI|nr:hypothetical protein B0J12DRAFT_694899 [Macrophomina phaseolina]
MPSASAHSTPSYAFVSPSFLSFSRSTVPIIWLLLMLNAMITSATRQCYYPNGLAAETAAPCFSSIPSDDLHRPCCRQPGLDSICLAQTASGLCLNQHATDSRAIIYVGGCTDPTYQDDACPSYCKSVELGDSSFHAIVPCQDGSWCCSAADDNGIGEASCCNSADQTFRLNLGDLLSVQQQSHPAVKTAGKNLNAAARQHHLVPRDDDNTTTNSTATATSTSSLPTTGIPLTSEDDDDDDDDDDNSEGGCSCPPDRSYIVGLSAGVPLGVCLLAALATIFVLLNRDRKARERIRAMTEAAREERERAAQEHVTPRLYGGAVSPAVGSAYAPSASAYAMSSKPRFSHGSTVIMAGGPPPPQTPQGQQQGYEGYELYDGSYADGGGGVGGGVIYGSGVPGDGVEVGAEGPGVRRHVSWATSTAGGGAGSGSGGVRGSHLSWSTAGRESSSWAYEHDGEPGARKERFEMTP